MFENLGAKILSEFGLNEFGDRKPLSEGISSIGDYFKTHSLNQIFPYENYDKTHQLFINRSTVGFVLETIPLVGCTEASQSQLSGLFQYILPEHSNIQFLLLADPYIGKGLERWCEARYQQSELFSLLADKRKAFLSRLALKENEGITIRNFRCLISVTIPIKDEDADSPVMNRFLKNVLEIKERIKETFKAVQMPALEVTPSILMQTIDDLVNPRLQSEDKCVSNLKHSQLDWNPYQPIREQIPTGSFSLSVKREGLHLNEGEHVFRFYGIRKYPSIWSQSMMSHLIGDPFQNMLQIPCPFFIHYGVHIPAQDKLKLKFMSKASHVERQAGTSFAKLIPEIREEARENQFVRNQLASNHRFVQTNLTVGILSPFELLSKYDQAVKNLYRANGWDLQENQYLHMQSLANIIPMSWGDEAIVDLQRTRKLKTTLSTESANLLPIQGEWYGTKSPGMIFVGRRGQQFTWSPFDNDESNYNVAIVGQSGSGKSAFMQELLTSVLGRGGRAFVIDIGRSFQKTCDLLGGDFLEFKNAKPICLNPFSSIKADDPSEVLDALEFVKRIICTMACPIEGESSLQAAILEKAIQKAWGENKRDTTITDVANILKADEDITARNLAKCLHSYTKEGLYGHFFEGKSEVTFQNQLTVIELEELKNNASLQNVILQMVILVITNQIYYGDRTTPFMIMFDEAWQVMEGRQGGKFIADLARRLRKYKSSLVTGTQNLSDFYKSDAANAAYQNSAWKCILSQSADVIHEVTKERDSSDGACLSISPFEKEMLLSIHTRQGKYSEIMIRGPHGFAVGRLLLDPFSRVLYSTQADEFSKVKEFVASGKTIAEAIELVARQKFPSEMGEDNKKEGFELIYLNSMKKEASHELEQAS